MIALLLLAQAGVQADAATSVVPVNELDGRLGLVDVDGDGDADLVLVESGGIAIRDMRPDGTYAAEPDRRIAWPSANAGWTLVDADANGTVELALYVDAERVRIVPLDGSEADASAFELEFAGELPRGHVRMDFLRDVNDDGRVDAVLPSFGAYSIFLRDAEGGYAEELRVRYESDIDYDFGAPDELGSTFGREVVVPWFSLEDIDGDGDVDLLSETSSEVFVHLASPQLAPDPTWRLDLDALRDELPEDDGIDLGDLLAQGARQARWRIDDFDGVVPNDLIVQVGGKFRVYLGGSRTGPTEAPDQVLKASGNVLWFFLRDSVGDDLADLHIVRGEKLALSRVIRWLVLPGSLDFDLFTYENTTRAKGGGDRRTGEAFARRPTRSNTLSLKVPRILAFASEMEELEEERQAAGVTPARRTVLGPDVLENDVVDLVDGELLVYADVVPEDANPLDLRSSEGASAAIERYLSDEIDTLEDGAVKTFDLREMARMNLGSGNALREMCADARPVVRAALAPGWEKGAVYGRDLDGDGREDWIVIGAPGLGAAESTRASSPPTGPAGDAVWVVQFVVRR